MIPDPNQTEEEFKDEEKAYQDKRLDTVIADGLRFVPEGDVPKVYSISCENASDWNEMHNYIINENEIDGIPNRKIDCTDLCKTCDRIASYEMSDAEADQLKTHPKIIGVELDSSYYSGTFKGLDDRIKSVTNRYASNVKVARQMGSVFMYSTTSDFLSKTGSSVYRHQQKVCPWNGIDDGTILDANPKYLGDGTDVDIVVCDESAWYGHTEFVKTGVGEPVNYVGGNVLKSGFATSATTGVCGVLDIVLDSPYYIDPDFFEADPSNRLMTRWDGTKVPVESVAKDWWRNESTAYRSAKYVGTSSGGTAVIGSAEDFGPIYVNTSQTRARNNGSHTSQHTSGGYHGTPCMSQAYGKNRGWAFNANKWHMAIIWQTGSQTIHNMFRILKIFHQLKPTRSSDNTKNPTITSHSWGRGTGVFSSNYFYRQPGDGTGGVAFSSWNLPGFMDNWSGWGGRYDVPTPVNSTEHILGSDCIDVGVFIFVAAGNSNQKQVLDGHPDYNNYYGPGNHTLAAAKQNGYVVNRAGFPASCGVVENYNNTGLDKNRAFNIGALDGRKSTNTSERKAWYSNMGNGIDCYAHGGSSLAAVDTNTSSRYDRTDLHYSIGGVQSLPSQDSFFGGTSSATPVTVGLIATKLQHKRTWIWSDVKDWLQNQVEDQTNAAFPEGDEPSSPNASEWNTYYSLMSTGYRKILWDAPIEDDRDVIISGPVNITGPLNITS